MAILEIDTFFQSVFWQLFCFVGTLMLDGVWAVPELSSLSDSARAVLMHKTQKNITTPILNNVFSLVCFSISTTYQTQPNPFGSFSPAHMYRRSI
jgi:hypothetical protein